MSTSTTPLIDNFGRQISYLRLSVTDRCDLRCTYCMAEKMTFLPKRDVLSFEELGRVTTAFIDRGVRKIRITGGEPLVRRDIMSLVDQLGARVSAGELDEVTLTTNATQLSRYAQNLVDAGVRRINVSLDTLNDDVFEQLTRRRMLSQVLAGIDAAQAAGLEVKLNTVALKNSNRDEIPSMIEWAHGRGMMMTLIEVMPLGEIEDDRINQYLPLTEVEQELRAQWSLTPTPLRTGGPARYWRVEQTGGLLGMITPLTNNFCDGCNRVRLTCTGKIYMCLGHTDHVDLRAALRGDGPPVEALLDTVMTGKPERHAFKINSKNSAPALSRHMSVTGG